MHVVILGSSNTGVSLARHLEAERHDVTILDSNELELERVRGELDVSILASEAISGPTALRDAGLEPDSILAAVSRDDVINIHACYVARKVLGCEHTLCRITSSHYDSLQQHITSASNPEGFIDTFIHPHVILAGHIADLLTLPGASGVKEYWAAPFLVFNVSAKTGGKHVDEPSINLMSHRSTAFNRIIGIERNGKILEVNDSTQIRSGDQVTLLASTSDAEELVRDLRPLENPYETVTIAGGGSTGVEVAEQLSSAQRKVTLIEVDKKRADLIRSLLPNDVLVIHADTQDHAKLQEAHVFDTDVFIAATGNDAENIITTQYAVSQGVRRVICVLRASGYSTLAKDIGAEVMYTGTVLHQEITRFMNRARARIVNLDVLLEHSIVELLLEPGVAEEFIGMHLIDIELPDHCSICAVVRNEQAMAIEDRLPLRQGDTLLVLAQSQRALSQLKGRFLLEV